MKNPWQCLEDLYGLVAVGKAWQQRVGNNYQDFKKTFLLSTGNEADTFPSDHVCECNLRVVRHGDGSIVGVSDCGSVGCKNIVLTKADLGLLELDWSKLGQAVAKAFDCQAKNVDLGLPGTWQVASFGSVPLAVVVTIQHDAAAFRSVVGQLVVRLPRPFILLAPTNRFMDGISQGFLANVKAGFFTLEEHLSLLPNGGLQASKSGGELFSPYLPAEKEQPLEVVARPPRFMFLKAGRVWKVIFDGAPEFHVNDTFGAKYLDYLLHHPNVRISAFDLEVAICPEKAKARSKDSIQRKLDPEAVKSYLRELEKLRAQYDQAKEEGNEGDLQRLEQDIAAIEEELKDKGQPGDTGEWARNNVRKAIDAVLVQLRKGGKHEKRFGEHVKTFVDKSYECIYNHPQGNIWQ